jgi:hypothetical protein
MHKEQIRKLRVHLIFALGIAVVLLIGTVTSIWSGQTVAQAVWNEIRQARPVEWLIIILWWYALAFPPNLDQWNNRNHASLGLNDPK